MDREGQFSDYALHWLLLVVPALLAFWWIRRHRGSPTRGRVAVGNVLVALALLGALVVAAETYLRYVHDTTTWHAGALTTRKWFARHEKLNSLGWRDREFDLATQPGRTRVVFVGDSFTWGYGVADPDDRYPDVVRTELARAHVGRFDVWNVARIGAATGEELAIVREMLSSCAVDRVVLGYSPNDVQDLLPPGIGDRASWTTAEEGTLRARSFLLDHLAVRLAGGDARGAAEYFDAIGDMHATPESFAPQTARFHELVRLCSDHGARLDVIVFPLLSHWEEPYPYDALHERVAGAWREAGVEVVDLRDAWRGHSRADLRVNALDHHPNERAHRLVAELILQRLFGAD